MGFSIIHTRVLGALLVLTLAGASPTAAYARSHQEYGPAADTERVVVLYRDRNLTPSKIRRLTEAGAPQDTIDVRRPDFVVLKTPKGRGRALAERIRSQPGVAAAAKVGRVKAAETVPPDDVRYAYDQGAVPYVGQQSYLGPVGAYPYSIGIEPVWDAIFNTDQYAAEPDRAGVSIAVIDSGYTASIMEDTGRVVPVWNYVDNNAVTLDTFPVKHGTRVTGIIGTQADNSYATAGVLHSTKSALRIYKVLDSTGSGTSEDTMMAMMDAADDGAKVINLSLGEPAVIDWPTSSVDTTYDLSPDHRLRALWQQVVDYCTDKGSIVVAASGNYANDQWAHDDVYTDVLYPAACTGALAVGSINPLTGATSPFSGYGSQLGVMAAGEGVWTTSSTGASSNSSPGTSYAAPLVSGALATLWSLVPDMPAAQLKSLATSTADGSLEEPGYDVRTGYGRFDASELYGAMKATLPVQSTPTTLTAATGPGFDTALTWSPVEERGVRYRYGYEGGPSYPSTGTTG
ncbi:MAG: S8 family peptidase, partial [Coriobacteriia bacterium]